MPERKMRLLPAVPELPKKPSKKKYARRPKSGEVTTRVHTPPKEFKSGGAMIAYFLLLHERRDVLRHLVSVLDQYITSDVDEPLVMPTEEDCAAKRITPAAIIGVQRELEEKLADTEEQIRTIGNKPPAIVPG